MEAQGTYTDHTNRSTGITIRRLGSGDSEALLHLAALDSAPHPAGEWLGLEVEGRLLAAASLDDRRTMADPFSRTAELRALLEVRVNQLQSREARRSGHRARRPATLAGSAPGTGGRILTLPLRSN